MKTAVCKTWLGLHGLRMAFPPLGDGPLPAVSLNEALRPKPDRQGGDSNSRTAAWSI